MHTTRTGGSILVLFISRPKEDSPAQDNLFGSERAAVVPLALKDLFKSQRARVFPSLVRLNGTVQYRPASNNNIFEIN